MGASYRRDWERLAGCQRLQSEQSVRLWVSLGEFFGECLMPTALEMVQDFMAAFVEAWPSADTTAVGSYFSEDALYFNGPLEQPVRACCHRSDIRSVHESRGSGRRRSDPHTGRRSDCHDRAERPPHES